MMTEYIVKLDDNDKDYEEMFYSNIRECEVLVRCKKCMYSVDMYNDGDCYCIRPDNEIIWIGDNWNFYCAAALRRAEDEKK